MDINTEVRHGETLLAADRRCYRVHLRRVSGETGARGRRLEAKSGQNKFVGVLELDCGLCGLCGLSRLRANLCLD